MKAQHVANPGCFATCIQVAMLPAAYLNLLKGAVGQAVQNMNIMFNLDETAGLRLKASAF